MDVHRPATRAVVTRGISTGVVLTVASVVTVLILHPRAATTTPETTTIVLTVLAALLCAYGYAARTASRLSTAGNIASLSIGGRFALTVSGCWIVEIVAGNVLDNHLYSRVLYVAALLGVAITSIATGVVATRRTGRVVDGAMAGVWSGVISGWVPIVTLVAITLLLPGTVSADPQNTAEAARSAMTNVLDFASADDIVAGTNHLWLGPLIGVILGALGAAIATILPQPGTHQPSPSR